MGPVDLQTMGVGNTTIDGDLNATRTMLDLGVPNNFSGPMVEDYTPYYTRPETYIVPVVFAIIFVVGVVGNGTLVVVFLRHRAMRNVPNTYILSLALADLLVIITCVPFTSTVYTVESWPWGESLCTISETAKDVSIGVSVFTLTALSADRFFAIVDPLRKLHTSGGGKRATRITIMAAVCIWLLAMLCAAPAAAGSYVRVFQVNPTTQFLACYPFPEEWGPGYPRLMVLLRFLLYYALPLAVIGVFYALMARHLVLSARNVPGELRGAARQVRARRKVAITVLAFVLIFAICFLPYHVTMMWFYYSPTAQEDYNAFWHIFRIVGFCLSFMNSCVNPVALYCVSGAFRKHFNRVEDTLSIDLVKDHYSEAKRCLKWLWSCLVTDLNSQISSMQKIRKGFEYSPQSQLPLVDQHASDLLEGFKQEEYGYFHTKPKMIVADPHSEIVHQKED